MLVESESSKLGCKLQVQQGPVLWRSLRNRIEAEVSPGKNKLDVLAGFRLSHSAVELRVYGTLICEMSFWDFSFRDKQCRDISWVVCQNRKVL